MALIPVLEEFTDVTTTNDVLRSISNDIQWIWIGNTKNSKFTNWDSGEPDNRDNNENCVAIFRAHDGRWHDRNCEDKLHSICAVRATSSIPRRPKDKEINHSVGHTSPSKYDINYVISSVYMEP